MSHPYLQQLTRRRAADLRLICFPHAGGGIADYARWRATIPPWIELWAVALPGREHRLAETMPTDLADVVTEVSAGLATIADGTPTAYFGHCAGSLLASETARRVESIAAPTHLAVSAAPAPDGAAGSDHLNKIFGQRRDALIAWMYRSGAIPPVVATDPTIARAVENLIYEDIDRCVRHPFPQRTRHSMSVSTFCGTGDPLVTPAQMRHWEALSSTPVSAFTYEGGDHFYLRTHAKGLLADLSSVLARDISEPASERTAY